MIDKKPFLIVKVPRVFSTAVYLRILFFCYYSYLNASIGLFKEAWRAG